MGGFGLTNPLLDAIKAARPELTNPAPTPPILNPGTASPQFSAIRAQTVKQPEQSAPPLIPPMNAPSVAPIGPSAQPSVRAPRGTVAGDEAYRGDLLSKGSGISQIKNPFLHGLARTGDVIGGLLSPRLMQAIPGTEEHHNLLLGNANKALTQDEANAEKEAQTANLQSEAAIRPSEIPLRQAQTHEAEARAQSLENPQAKEKEEQWTITPEYTGPNGEPVEVEKNSGQMRIAGQGGPAFKRVEKPTAQKGLEHVSLSGPGGKPMEANFHPDTGKYTDAAGNEIANPQPYQKPEKGPTIIQQQGEVDRIAGRLAKPYDEGYKQGNATLQRIQQTQHSVDAGYVGQGLAIPELLTSVVSGQGTGVRITQPELNAITSARGIKGDAESWFNSLAGKGKLTDTDKAQIKAVLQDARKRIEEKTQINSQALDAINGAESRGDAVNADKEARQKLNDLEKSGHFVGQTVNTKNGTKVITALHSDGSFDAN